jgi:hypothetical protein
MHVISRTWAGAFAALLALPLAAEPATPSAPAATLPAIAGQPSPVQPAAASADVLGAARGGSDAIASDTRVQGGVNGNTATNVNTGANLIQSGSFANAVGIPVVIQNSGANVLIQNATVINVQFK